MEKLKIKKEDGNTVSCILEVPEDPKGIVIAVHGFTSSKECQTYKLLLRRLPLAGLGMLGIDLPGHGFEESLDETLRIEGAVNSIEAAERYVSERFPGIDIYYFASSFGAYLTGIYISTRKHVGKKAFFRSAAVNMPALFIKDKLTEAEKKQRDELYEKGFFDMSMDQNKPVRITKELFEDFSKTDLFEIFDMNRFGKTQVAMAHGANDSVIDLYEARRFAGMFNIPLSVFEKEGHSLADSADTPDKVADLALRLYIGI